MYLKKRSFRYKPPSSLGFNFLLEITSHKKVLDEYFNESTVNICTPIVHISKKGLSVQKLLQKT